MIDNSYVTEESTLAREKAQALDPKLILEFFRKAQMDTS